MDVETFNDFNSKLIDSLTESNTSEIWRLLNAAENQQSIKNELSSIITTLCETLTPENHRKNNALFECCVDGLIVLAKNHDQVDVILGILQQMEYDGNDVRYGALLTPLVHSLKRPHNDRTKYLEWTISTIKSYISSIPKDEKFQSSETLQNLESSESENYNFNKEVVQKVYLTTLDFLVKLEGPEVEKYLLSTIIFMFGPPYCFINDTFWTETKILDRMVGFFFSLCPDPVEFLPLIKRRFQTKKESCVNYLFENEDHVPVLGFANLFATVFVLDEFQSQLPQVYQPEYLLHGCLQLSQVMLAKVQYPNCLLSKSLLFSKCILIKVEKLSIVAAALELPVHKEFLTSVTQTMIYCSSTKVRTLALEIFRLYMGVFSLEARYRVVLQLYRTANHSGLLSLVTGIFKNSVIECLQNGSNEFLGLRLRSLLKLACRLEHGRMSDLIELSDEIITSLNLVLFLIIRDEGNETGFWEVVEEIEKEFLKPLRDGIELARTHWRIKLNDLGGKEEEKVTISIGGEDLKMLPTEQKVKVCYNALNALDVMQNVLTRVNESLESKKRERMMAN